MKNTRKMGSCTDTVSPWLEALQVVLAQPRPKTTRRETERLMNVAGGPQGEIGEEFFREICLA